MNEVARFSVEYTRFLDSKGEVQQELPAFTHNVQELIKLYQQMMLTRLFDYKAVALQRTGMLNTYASILGQEAISVGIGASMQSKDILCPFYRDYAAQLMRGVKMSEILNFWKGNEWGNYFSECPLDFPICIPIATQLLQATGVATAFKIRKQARIVVSTCGDGATSEGDFYEALNIAGAWQLPIVFVIDNNQWAISVPRKHQTHAQTLAQKAIAAGIHGEQVDGNDLIAMKFVMDRAIAKARNGEGPSLIEALSYRLSDHTTADDASRYRREEELQQAWQEEPLRRLRNYLIKEGSWSDEAEKNFKKECQQMIEVAVNDYFSLAKPAVTDMFDYHYAELPQDLIEQRIEAEALLMLNKELASG
jgi:2-oxoisovalerate dehydrogenase E1 component alpha subunit